MFRATFRIRSFLLVFVLVLRRFFLRRVFWLSLIFVFLFLSLPFIYKIRGNGSQKRTKEEPGELLLLSLSLFERARMGFILSPPFSFSFTFSFSCSDCLRGLPENEYGKKSRKRTVRDWNSTFALFRRFQEGLFEFIRTQTIALRSLVTGSKESIIILLTMREMKKQKKDGQDD